MQKYSDIKLDEDINEYLYVQLYNDLKKKIINNEIEGNTKLPPIRKFASILNVNNTTIVKAYKLLEDDSLVYKKVGSGTYVMDIAQNQPEDENAYVEYSKDMINLGSGTPSEKLFPVEDFKEAINYVLDKYQGKAFGYKDSKGDQGLRYIIYDKLVKGKIDVTRDEIQIISGAQQGIDIVSKALLNPRDCVMIESPTYTGAIAIFKSRGCRFSTIDINFNGIDFVEFEEKIKKNKPKMFFTMPNLHNPTGYTYSKEEKVKIIELAKKYDFYIVEDDYSSELNFSNNDISTLKELDDDERVIYIKSFSKIFLPGLRLGYLIAPKKLEKSITRAKHTTDISTSGLIQKSFEYFLQNKKWDRQVKIMYDMFISKYEIAIDVLESKLPDGIIFNKPYGGVNFWLEFDNSVDISDLYEYLLNENIIIAPGKAFYLKSNKTNNMRVSIASIDKEVLEKSLTKFCQKIDDYLNDKKQSRTIPIL